MAAPAAYRIVVPIPPVDGSEEPLVFLMTMAAVPVVTSPGLAAVPSTVTSILVKASVAVPAQFCPLTVVAEILTSKSFAGRL